MFFSYIKMYKNSSAKYYQKKTKKSFRKKLMKAIKIFLKKRKAKSNKMVANDLKISQERKNKGQLSMEKILQNMET